MPGLYKDEAVVLSTIKLGEADRIVSLFTRYNGKVRAVAKGVRKTKSRFGGRLEPFTHVDLVVYEGRNLDTITAADIRESFAGVRADLVRLASAAAIGELVDKITPERERAAPVYSLLLAALRALDSGKGATVVPAFAIKLLSISGYHPQLQACAGCGRSGDFNAFSAAIGGAVCDECRREDGTALRIAPGHAALLARLLASDFGEAAETGAVTAVTQLLKSYAEYYLERPLRSLRFLAAMS